MKTLVIFDIDGTLLHSADLHHRLITRILAEDGLDVTFQPWAAYPHYTDLGVLQALYGQFRGRAIRPEELERYDRLYERALRAHLAESAVPEVAGAGRLMRGLLRMPDVRLAFATGSLPRMARVKLGLLGVDADRAALATGGEHLTREAILRAAARRSGVGGAFRAVSLGDGPWDQRTAENLGLPFVALETGTHVFGAGPVRRLADFTRIGAEDLVALARPVEWPENAERPENAKGMA
ncbi:HAD family hydrolase [Pseudogemmobacter sonorensis]|uniref:HAD family hydrolase n=1 Tax=Pseudogemmobacter sonorensis TaxID=2989681 RepID=UPI0036B3C47D